MANIDRQTTLTPATAAQRLCVEVYTVRRWCDWHAAYLSPGASPGPGALRRLNGRDIEVLLQVRDLRAQGLHTETINEQLAGLTFAEIDTNESGEIGSELAPQPSQEALQAPSAILVALEAMQRQLDGYQRARRDNVIVFSFGFMAAGIMFLLLIGLAWLYSGG